MTTGKVSCVLTATKASETRCESVSPAGFAAWVRM